MLTYKSDPEADFTLFIGEGSAPVESWRSLWKSYDNQTPTKYELYDLRQLTQTFEERDIRIIAALSMDKKNVRPKGSKTALVVSDSVHRWLSRFYAILAEIEEVPWETREFSNMGQAADWLGIELSRIEQLRTR